MSNLFGPSRIVSPLPSGAGAGAGVGTMRREGTMRGVGSGGRAAAAVGFAWRSARSAPVLVGYVRRLRRVLDRLRPDLIHSNGIKTHLALRLAGGWRRGGATGVP